MILESNGLALAEPSPWLEEVLFARGAGDPERPIHCVLRVGSSRNSWRLSSSGRLGYGSWRSQRRLTLDLCTDIFSEGAMAKPYAALGAQPLPNHAAGPPLFESGFDVVFRSQKLDPVTTAAAFLKRILTLPEPVRERLNDGFFCHGAQINTPTSKTGQVRTIQDSAVRSRLKSAHNPYKPAS